MKFEGQILGKMKQQLGKSFVFFVWKGIQVARQYVTPANPQTVNQTIQREKFALLLTIAQSVQITLIQKFWKKFAVKMSAFNAFMSSNLKAQGSVFVPLDLIFSKGSLLETPINTATFDPESGVLRIAYPTSVSGNQLATDKAVGVCYNSDSQIVYVNDTTFTRAAGLLEWTIAEALNPVNLSAFLFFYRNVGTTQESISNSVSSAVS